jgi:sec-independent protein translocase protein TatA
VVLGPKRLPEVGRAVGKGIRDFKDAINGEHDEPKGEVMSAEAPKPANEPADRVA